MTLILYTMTAGMFCTIWFLIDRNWWSKIVEVLVGFQDSTWHTADRIFQTSMSLLILDAYNQSVSALLVPVHGCWVNDTPLYYTQNKLTSTYEYVFQHGLLCWLAHLFSHKKELSGRQQPQSKSCWPWSGLPWHTKDKRFSVMGYAAVFYTCKPRLVSCMCFTAMEPCYSYRECKGLYIISLTDGLSI